MGLSLCAPFLLRSGEEGLWGQARNKSYVRDPIPERGSRRLGTDEADKVDPLGQSPPWRSLRPQGPVSRDAVPGRPPCFLRVYGVLGDKQRGVLGCRAEGFRGDLLSRRLAPTYMRGQWERWRRLWCPPRPPSRLVTSAAENVLVSLPDLPLSGEVPSPEGAVLPTHLTPQLGTERPGRRRPALDAACADAVATAVGGRPSQPGVRASSPGLAEGLGRWGESLEARAGERPRAGL